MGHGWTLEKRESDHYVKVLRERNDSRVKTCPVTEEKVHHVPVPDQLPNECPARALNEAMELALKWSHGREGLARNAICSQSKRSCKSKIARQTNAQSDNTRTFMFLSVFKAAAATLGLDFFETLGQVKQSLLKRTKPMVAPAPVPDLSQGNQRLLQQPSDRASAAVCSAKYSAACIVVWAMGIYGMPAGKIFCCLHCGVGDGHLLVTACSIWVRWLKLVQQACQEKT